MKQSKSKKPQHTYQLALERAEKEIARLNDLLAEVRRVSESPIYELTPQKRWQFTHYVRLLLEWNQRVDLISPNDENRITERHLLESLAVLSVWRFITGATVLDLGSGAGLPGIPLKILRPDLKMTLLESRQKKSFFLQFTQRHLALENCFVLCDRAEHLAQSSEQRFEVIIARAVADLRKLWRWSRPLLVSGSKHHAGGVLLAMKGGEMEEELHALLKFDAAVSYRVLRYSAEWQVDPSRCLVAVFGESNSLES